MKPRKITAIFLAAALAVAPAGCGSEAPAPTEVPTTVAPTEQTEQTEQTEVTDIVLSDDGVTCASDAVYTANDIIYYESGHDESYGEGDETDAHDAAEAAAHTVVHITAAGTYRVTGTLSAGQLFVDLGEDAKNDPAARVTLLLDNAEITCTVAPAVFFYRVYECSDDEVFTLTPDLSEAGAVVELADGSCNLVNGAYVARIYKEGTTDKLHKYDGAFYSRMSMRIEGDTGSLTVNGTNEGLDTELHLEINGGNLTIVSQDDGINTNEDGISVTTVNGGFLSVNGGYGDEGDGIDSNGALVINGGTVFASANERTGDGGIDADVGIYLNGGTVVAAGSRNDSAAAESTQQYMELTFAQTVREGSEVCIKSGEEVLYSDTVTRPFSSLTVSMPELEAGVAYTVTVDGVVQQHGGPTASMGKPEVGLPEPPGGMDAPIEAVEGGEPNGEPPEKPDGEAPEKPDGERPTLPDGGADTEVSQEFTLTEANHRFFNVCDAN